MSAECHYTDMSDLTYKSTYFSSLKCLLLTHQFPPSHTSISSFSHINFLLLTHQVPTSYTQITLLKLPTSLCRTLLPYGWPITEPKTHVAKTEAKAASYTVAQSVMAPSTTKLALARAHAFLAALKIHRGQTTSLCRKTSHCPITLRMPES